MFLDKKKATAVVCSVFIMGGLTSISVPAQAGFLGKITKAVIYPIRKVGSNASVDTHRVLQTNSVEKSSSPTSSNEVVKPDGHKVPISRN